MVGKLIPSLSAASRSRSNSCPFSSSNLPLDFPLLRIGTKSYRQCRPRSTAIRPLSSAESSSNIDKNTSYLTQQLYCTYTSRFPETNRLPEGCFDALACSFPHPANLLSAFVSSDGNVPGSGPNQSEPFRHRDGPSRRSPSRGRGDHQERRHRCNPDHRNRRRRGISRVLSAARILRHSSGKTGVRR